jgi:uncharacterized membrane protein
LLLPDTGCNLRIALKWRIPWEIAMKILNIVMMVLMALLCGRELLDMANNGVNSTNALFAAVFGAFAVRRAMLMSKYSAQ